MSLNRKISEWQGMRIWIVGASAGIGHALAKALLERGAAVAISARNAEALDALASQYPQAIALPLDASNSAAWERAYQKLHSWWRELDYLIYCAADYQPMQADTLEVTRASRMIDINLKGAIFGVSTVIKDMLARRAGGIAIMASVAGYAGLPKALVYGPTKAALINFCESLYLDVHPRGIAVHVINPGFVDAPLTTGKNLKMLALISTDEAASEIIRGLEAGEFEIHFPRRFTRWLKLLKQSPYAVQFRALLKVATRP